MLRWSEDRARAGRVHVASWKRREDGPKALEVVTITVHLDHLEILETRVNITWRETSCKHDGHS